MSVWLGALKGVSRGVLLLVALALVPGVAFAVAHFGEGLAGLGFWTLFWATLALELVLGVAALFGIASEVQRPDFEAVAESSREQRPG
jgi:membrane protein implicated in regulation of membrane protease activity